MKNYWMPPQAVSKRRRDVVKNTRKVKTYRARRRGVLSDAQWFRQQGHRRIHRQSCLFPECLYLSKRCETNGEAQELLRRHLVRVHGAHA
jgi:hypothetical protein